MGTVTAAPLCPPRGEVETVALARVLDGDTVVLADGRRVRLVGINTPERARRRRPVEPLAGEAARALRHWLRSGTRLTLAVAPERRDRYGRVLGHLFRDGDHASAWLARHGWGFPAPVPPNVAYADCLARVAAPARRQERGVWAETAFGPWPARALPDNPGGFLRVSGRVTAVQAGGDGWWVDLDGPLVLRVLRRDRRYFPDPDFPEGLRGQRITVRGWVVDRRDQPWVRERGYAPFMMPLRHPTALRVMTTP